MKRASQSGLLGCCLVFALHCGGDDSGGPAASAGQAGSSNTGGSGGNSGAAGSGASGVSGGGGAGTAGASGNAGSANAGNGGSAGNSGSSGNGGNSGSSGNSGNSGSAGNSGNSGSSGTAGSAGSAGSSASGGNGGSGTTFDLCAGLVTDKDDRPQTDLPKPALGQTVIDAEFGTTIRRITAVSAGSGDRVIKPMYSTISAWNADESRLILYSVADGAHQLYNGTTYEFIEVLDISPPDLEQVYWHTQDPDILYYVDGIDFVEYRVSSHAKTVLTSFDFCSAGASGGSDPLFTSFDSHRIGLHCGSTVFIYDISQNMVLASVNLDENPAQVAPSGTLAYRSDTGIVTDSQLNEIGTVDLIEPWGHASLGILPNGHDTWNGAVYDPGPNGNDDIGVLVTWDLNTLTSHVVIGPKTGYPYPNTGHISGLCYKQPGWVFVSTIGDGLGQSLLDGEMIVANTVTNQVCRAGRHRSFGKSNTQLSESYWAEPHMVPSPSGTRAVFGSDWGNGATVDTYVLELPAYAPLLIYWDHVFVVLPQKGYSNKNNSMLYPHSDEPTSAPYLCVGDLLGVVRGRFGFC